MAVTNTTVLAGTTTFIVDTLSSANADVTTGNMPHGLGAIPLDVSITPMALAFWSSIPFVATLDATDVVLTLANAVGSGDAVNIQIRTRVSLPHTLVR